MTAFLAVAALYTFVLIVRTEDALRNVSRYNVTWLASQAVPELTRLQAAIGAFAVPGSGVDQDEVQLRLDILANRANLLESGETGDFIQSRPELAAVVAKLRERIAAAQPLVTAIEHDGSVKQLLILLAPLNAKLTKLATAAYTHGGELTASDLQQLGSLHWRFSGLLSVLIACGFGLIGTLTWHIRLLRRAHTEVQTLVASLQKTGSELANAKEQVQQAFEEAALQNRILKERDRDLFTQNTRFDAALNNMSQGLCMVDADQRLIVCNTRFQELFGLEPGAMRPGALAGDLFRMIGVCSRYDQEVIEGIWLEQQAMAAACRPGAFFREGEHGRAVAVAHQPMADGGWVATYEDITERRRAEARISFLAHHDAVTGLPNRVLFRERLEQVLGEPRHKDGELALLLLDLDHFKNVNDTLGHAAGDALLEAVGKRLQSCVHGSNLVARLGGDEFAILQLSASASREAEELARRIVEVVSAPYDLGSRRAVVGVSVGIAVATEAAESASQLLKNADMALYRAKADGRATFRFFETRMALELQQRFAIESDLRAALEQGQFEVFYQPLLNLRSNRVSGFEALLRWHHPERGMVSPAQFIPIAEELGLIVPIGEWVLQQACTDAMKWPEHIKVTVNLSPVQFRGVDIVQTVSKALTLSGLSPSRLELEITESTLLHESEKVVAMLHRLRDLGLRTALDDFGTGYSSLSYLRSFPFDKIKIDQSFVRDMAERSDCLAIVNSIADLARRLGMTATAEGVESPDQLRQVREAGCTEAQGYHCGRPMPLAEVQGWLAATGGALAAYA